MPCWACPLSTLSLSGAQYWQFAQIVGTDFGMSFFTFESFQTVLDRPGMSRIFFDKPWPGVDHSFSFDHFR
jgi:hypothetical protein